MVFYFGARRARCGLEVDQHVKKQYMWVFDWLLRVVAKRIQGAISLGMEACTWEWAS